MKKMIQLLKTETVFIVSGILALLSCFLNKPSEEYIKYIDFKVLICLFVLMLAVAGLGKSKVLEVLSVRLIKRFKNTRSIIIAIIFVTFTASMLLTNDVALITFVPISLIIMRQIKNPKLIIPTVILQTIAANMGSMATPIGNPQNLYLFSYYNMSLSGFFAAVLPIAALSLILLLACCLFIKKEEPIISLQEEKLENKPQCAMGIVIMILAVLSVFRLLSPYITLIIAVLLVCCINPKLFGKADYFLLMTFVFFFIFIGNITKLPSVQTWIAPVLGKRGSVYTAGVAASQIVSNVPAAILLSGFTANAKELMLGVDIGGNGTLIASLASLISYKLLIREYPHENSRYFWQYALASFLFLAVLYAAGWMLV